MVVETPSELEIFKVLSNPTRVNLKKTGVVADAISVAMSTHNAQLVPEQSTHNAQLVPEQSTHNAQLVPEKSTPEKSVPEQPMRETPKQAMHEKSQPPVCEDDEAAEKHALLIELNKLVAEGVTLSRAFTIDSNYNDMLFEYNRQTTQITTTRHVSTAFDMLTGVARGLEALNSKMGPVLNLNGWAESVVTKRTEYIPVMTRLYNKRWRRGLAVSPEMEFAWLLGSGMVAYHMSRADILGVLSPSVTPPAPRVVPQSATMPPPRRLPHTSI